MARRFEITDYLQIPTVRTKLNDAWYKFQPYKLAQLDPTLQGDYFSGMTNLGLKVRPKFLRIEASFSASGNSVKSKELITDPGTTMARRLISFFDKKQDIDVFDDFVVRYKDNDGNDSVFNLLSGKKNFERTVDLKALNHNRDWYDLIDTDFKEFIATL